MQERLVLEEADKIWFEYSEQLSPPPHGYVIYETRTGKIVHERTLGTPDPEITAATVMEPAFVKRRPSRWRWPWS